MLVPLSRCWISAASRAMRDKPRDARQAARCAASRGAPRDAQQAATPRDAQSTATPRDAMRGKPRGKPRNGESISVDIPACRDVGQPGRVNDADVHFICGPEGIPLQYAAEEHTVPPSTVQRP